MTVSFVDVFLAKAHPDFLMVAGEGNNEELITRGA